MDRPVILKNLPIPPSINSSYVTDFRTKRRFKSKELVNFQTLMLDWANESESSLIGFRDIIKSWIDNGDGLRFTCNFFLNGSRLFTKKNTRKRLDVSNRIKALEDSISEILDYDDCHHTTVSASKFSMGNCQTESVIVSIERESQLS